MEKNLEYYLGLPYTRELIPEPEGGWFIRIKELPGCMSQGDTTDEAMAMIEDAMKGWLEVELDKGSVIPEPRPDEEFSGKFIVRVAKSLHRKISEISTFEGVSLNQWIGTTLAEAVGETSANNATENEGGVEHTSGLFSAMEGILTGIYAGTSELKVDEQTFSRWLDRNLEEIFSELDNPSGSQFTEKTRSLLNCLMPHQEHSPLITSFCRLLVVMVEVGSKYSSMIDKQNQISDIIRSINQPASSKLTQDTLHDKKNLRSLESNILRDISNPYDLRS